MVWVLGIEAFLILAFGIYWSFNSSNSKEIPETDYNEKKIKNLENEILELSNKLANLEGRFQGMRDYLREKL